jgi:hypothetical protein
LPIAATAMAVVHLRSDRGEQTIMTSKSEIALTALLGAAVGGAAIHGLHAQAKPKAYTVTELETLDAKAAADFATRVAKMQESAGGRNLRTGGGKVTSMEGPPPPPSVSRSQNGITSTKHKHSSSQRSGPISDRSVTRRSRPCAATRWNNGTDNFPRGRQHSKRRLPK